ncbi:MAG: hypothetical protein ACFFE8_01385 [Candidatus Heimdallarchaeota archaeon]
MESTLETSYILGLLVIAVLLGIKHAFDADHLVAVSGLLTHSQTTRKTISLSVSWALGHMATATVLTIVLFIFRESIFLPMLANLELLVPVMLIIIAIFTIAWEFNLIHFHRHSHGVEVDEAKEHTHLHVHLSSSSQREHGTMVGIGVIHGIASNDELLLLFTLTLGIQDLLSILFGVLLFTTGVIIGMIGYGVSVNYPAQKFGQKRVTRVINLSIAALSLVYAIWLLLGLQGINIFEIFSPGNS